MSWRVASSQPKLISATDFRDGLGERDQFRRIFVEARGIAQRVFQERMEHELSRVLTIGAKYRAYAGERERRRNAHLPGPLGSGAPLPKFGR